MLTGCEYPGMAATAWWLVTTVPARAMAARASAVRAFRRTGPTVGVVARDRDGRRVPWVRARRALEDRHRAAAEADRDQPPQDGSAGRSPDGDGPRHGRRGVDRHRQRRPARRRAAAP